MEKYSFVITAHIVLGDYINDDAMLVYSKDYDTYPNGGHYGQILAETEKAIPCVDWSLDDGDDTAGTDYCQYVAYTDGNSYLLASWNKI